VESDAKPVRELPSLTLTVQSISTPSSM